MNIYIYVNINQLNIYNILLLLYILGFLQYFLLYFLHHKLIHYDGQIHH